MGADKQRTLLSREDILNAEDLRIEEVDVPEWGGTVRVRGMTGVERDRFESSIVTTRGAGNTQVNLNNVRAKLLSLTIVDEDGQLMFSQGDIESLGQKSAAALQRVFNVAQRLSGISQDDVEELAGN